MHILYKKNLIDKIKCTKIITKLLSTGKVDSKKNDLINYLNLIDENNNNENDVVKTDCYSIIEKNEKNEHLIKSNEVKKMNTNNKSSYYDVGTNKKRFNFRLISLNDFFFNDSHFAHKTIFSTQNNINKRGNKIENKKFLDLKILSLKSGNGGNGCISFFSDLYNLVGPADGGDGGNGGDILVRINKNINSFHILNSNYTAQDGKTGQKGQTKGKNGSNLVIDIPLGTVIRWIPSPALLKTFAESRKKKNLKDIFLKIAFDENENIQLFRKKFNSDSLWMFKNKNEKSLEDKDFFIKLKKKFSDCDVEILHEELEFDKIPFVGLDFSKYTSETFTLLKGGKGGLGNMHFSVNNVRNPYFCKPGRTGLNGFFLFELKLLADIGFVGFPNAGKSTLLRAISAAKPKVGHWPFTTLQPTIGTIQPSIEKKSFTVADIPGIIKDASLNKGMGLDFLRHIERTRVLAFTVSLESDDPIYDLNILISEIGKKSFEKKKSIVILTKADLTSNSEKYDKMKNYLDKKKWPLIAISALKRHNIEECIDLMNSVVST